MFRSLRWSAIALVALFLVPTASGQEGPRPENPITERPGSTDPATALSAPVPKKKRSEFPDFKSTMDGYSATKGFYTLYTKKDSLYAVVPSSRLGRDFMLATSFSGGTPFAGWQWNDYLFYWKRMGKRLVLMQRNVFFTGGKKEVRDVVKRTYTDRVFITVPIITRGGGGYVINLGGLLAGRSSKFFGYLGSGDSSLAKFALKSFPYNSEITVTMPGPDGRFVSLHYSIADYANLCSSRYKPRVADDRVGYFLTAAKDFGKTDDPENFVRYINRWNLQKRDPKLAFSPPKKPIVFYIEKTVPVKYRRFVREGIEMWNKAYEKCGFINAIEVRQQESFNEFKDLSPEDARYNFFRWIASERAFAMGPSRANPKTGEIFDADIVMDDSMVAAYLREYESVIRDFNDARLTDRAKAYLKSHPRRNPDRVLRRMLGGRSRAAASHANTSAPNAHADCATCRAREHAAASHDPNVAARAATQMPDAMRHRHCALGRGKVHDLALANLWFALLDDDDDDDDDDDKKKKKKKKDTDKKDAAKKETTTEAEKSDDDEKAETKDDDKKKDTAKKDDDKKKAKAKAKKKSAARRDAFIGEVIREIVCHEVGHTLGLRHNFKASTYRTLDEINSAKKPADTVGSVMDYNPINLAVTGEQGHWAPSALGPYDYWAIEYGYKQASKSDLVKIAARGATKGLHYGTDEDLFQGDPTINQWDLGTDPIAYAGTRIQFVEKLLGKLEARAVKKGEGYQKLRRAFDMLLFEVRNAGDFAVRYVGGHYANRDHKGDPDGRDPIVPLPAAKQREGLKFVCEHIFSDRHFSFDAALLRKLAQQRWMHEGAYPGTDLAFPLHERVLNLQTWVMFDLFYPGTLRRILDQEKMVGEKEDCFTLAELFDTLEASVWSELAAAPENGTARKPIISTVRRNLQRYYLEQMIDLALEPSSWMPSTVGMLARHHLKRLGETIEAYLANKAYAEALDTYTRAHLEEAKTLIEKALQAAYQLGGKQSGGMGGFLFF